MGKRASGHSWATKASAVRAMVRASERCTGHCLWGQCTHSWADGHSCASTVGAKASAVRATVRASERCTGHVVCRASRVARPAGNASSRKRNRSGDGGTIHRVHIRPRMVDASRGLEREMGKRAAGSVYVTRRVHMHDTSMLVESARRASASSRFCFVFC